MCGIAGQISLKSAQVDLDVLARMTDLIAYRGPDDQGFLLAGKQGVATFGSSRELRSHSGFLPILGLGHRRLSILDLSEAGHQPMAYMNGSYWIVFNGEIYNYIELRQSLQAIGYAFKSGSDTEVIMAAYDAWGESCVSRFWGMWAFAIYDVRNHKVFCSRDRWGIKPFYYRHDSNCFTFGSEIKQLLLGISAKAHLPTLYDLLLLKYTDHLPTTCFEGILQLLPGHNLILDLQKGTFQIDRYYSLKPRHSFAEDQMEAASAEVLTLLDESIKVRLRSDVPVGSCLSGGLDSSAIVALMSRQLRSGPSADAQQHAFTFVSSQQDQDETEYANMVAAATNATHHLIVPNNEQVIQDIPKMVWHMDEPVGGLSILAQWYVFEAARAKGVKVMLDGQAGDELFLGYERYFTANIRHLLCQGNIKSALRECWLSARRSRLSHAKQLAQLLYFQLPPVRSLLLRNRARLWLDENFIRSSDLTGRVRHLGLAPDIEQMQIQEISSTQLPHLLRYEDRNSMAHSVEARLPILDHRLVELAIGMPYSLKIQNGWTKYAFRKAVENLVPSQIVWRKRKIGFEAPQKQWLGLIKQEMDKTFAGELASAGIIDAGRLRKSLTRNAFDESMRWRVYNLEVWFRQFNVSIR